MNFEFKLSYNASVLNEWSYLPLVLAGVIDPRDAPPPVIKQPGKYSVEIKSVWTTLVRYSIEWFENFRIIIFTLSGQILCFLACLFVNEHKFKDCDLIQHRVIIIAICM